MRLEGEVMSMLIEFSETKDLRNIEVSLQFVLKVTAE